MHSNAWRSAVPTIALVLTLFAIGLSLGVERAAAATTEIGAVSEIGAAQRPSSITSGGYVVQVAEGTGTYAVPPGYGTITAWSHSAGSTSGSLTFKVYRPTGAQREFVAVASDTRTVAAGRVHTFPVRIAVLPGDRLGLSSEDVELAYASGDLADRIGFFGVDLPLGATRATDGEPFEEYRLDVAATLESTAPGGDTGQPPAGGGGGVAVAPSRPAVTGLRIAPRAFAAARRGPSVRPAARRGGAARVTYRLNVATTVRFTVRRVRPGRRSGRGARCVAQTRRNRRAARCTREVPLRGSFTHAARAGANSLRFTGRLGGLRLRPGAYRLVATPAPAGAPARAATAAFRIVR
jgi:hypothetical protein